MNFVGVPLHSFGLLNIGEYQRVGDYVVRKNGLLKIRKDVEDCIGKKVILKANKGRKKTTVREGIIESAYPSIFVVKICNQYDNTAGYHTPIQIY